MESDGWVEVHPGTGRVVNASALRTAWMVLMVLFATNAVLVVSSFIVLIYTAGAHAKRVKLLAKFGPFLLGAAFCVTLLERKLNHVNVYLLRDVALTFYWYTIYGFVYSAHFEFLDKFAKYHTSKQSIQSKLSIQSRTDLKAIKKRGSMYQGRSKRALQMVILISFAVPIPLSVGLKGRYATIRLWYFWLALVDLFLLQATFFFMSALLNDIKLALSLQLKSSSSSTNVSREVNESFQRTKKAIYILIACSCAGFATAAAMHLTFGLSAKAIANNEIIEVIVSMTGIGSQLAMTISKIYQRLVRRKAKYKTKYKRKVRVIGVSTVANSSGTSLEGLN